uniref:Uncharacterized protein n=1 Tax=Ananas comosus var. bracteatus TaxID=296719 RepID=A0A6V7PW45_ANACO|nr:unnamed protein product [Ananas comosus var. bracteatus]
MAPLVRDILAFHKIDRALYDKFVAHGTNPQLARNVVTLIMWLDLIGINIVGFTRELQNHAEIVRFVSESEVVLNCLRQDSPPLSPKGGAYAEIPTISSLARESFDLRFFLFHQDMVVRGLAQLLDGVGTVIFDDGLNALFWAHEAAVRAAEEEARWKGSRSVLPPLPPELAKPYYCRGLAPMPDDCRSMFITFSKGNPLRRDEIVEYFTERWGDCIERVMMERTPPGVTPMYGRIVFTGESFIGLVLNGERLVKFMINGRQLWARKYVPRIN